MSFKRLVAGVFAAALLVPVAIAALPANASNKGDVWATNSPDAGAGHAHEPHLSCGTIYLHGSALADGGTYTIDSIPPSGSGAQVWSGTWSTPSSGDVIATLSGSDLVAAAVTLDNATPNVNQGYHFKLDLSQEGVKHKTFWVRCSEEPPAPTLDVTKTADKASVVSGDDIGFTITVGPDEGSFADDVALSDPLPKEAGIDWSIDPAYTGPGTCTIGGSAPGQQTLHCSVGDLGAPENPVSATVHVASHTVAGTTAAHGNITIDNTATATADDLDPVKASASIFIDPASPSLAITKTADHASVTAGDQAAFTVVVTNHGPGLASAVTLNDPLPDGAAMTWAINPAYSGPGTCSITGTGAAQTLSCSLGDLAGGASASVHVAATTPAASAVTLDNLATAAAHNNPAVTATARIVSHVPGTPELAVTKTADAASVTAGHAVGFTILVANNGDGIAHNATLSDPLPGAAGTIWSISPAYGGPGSCSITGSGGSQTLACSFGDLGAGGSASVHVSSSTTAAGTLTNVALSKADNNPTVTATAQVVVDPVGGASVLGATSSSTPTTQVLGLRLSKPNAAVLPVTGNPPMWLLAPGLALLGVGAEVLALARRRLAVRA